MRRYSDLRQLKRRFGALELRLRGVERDLVRLLLDNEQQIARFHVGPVFEENLLEVAIDRARRSTVAVASVRPTNSIESATGFSIGWRDRDLRRRRRDELVLRLAAAEEDAEQAESDREPQHPRSEIDYQSQDGALKLCRERST